MSALLPETVAALIAVDTQRAREVADGAADACNKAPCPTCDFLIGQLSTIARLEADEIDALRAAIANAGMLINAKPDGTTYITLEPMRRA